LTETQKHLVQKSFEKVLPIADTAAQLFYGRLFEIDPSLKPMFTSDMNEQGKKLMMTLNVAVKGLDRLEELLPQLEKLGRNHVSYGVKDEHYDTIAEALLWTLEKGLGDEFTPEVKDAWISVYTVIANTMKKAASEVTIEEEILN
jgi:hemoglobin-like flavoprotein